MNKATLRKLYIDKRTSLQADEVNQLNANLLEQFQQLPLPGHIELVMSFKPMPKFNEPNVELLLKHLQTQKSNIEVALPKVNKGSQTISAYKIDTTTQFTTSGFSIVEPLSDKPIAPQEVDMVLVPLLTFDPSGYRVGYGKGMYDKFLQQCRHDTLKVGISFFEAVDSIDDIHSFDIPLDYCITPHKIYNFGDKVSQN